MPDVPIETPDEEPQDWDLDERDRWMDDHDNDEEDDAVVVVGPDE